MRRSRLIFGILICYLTGCFGQPNDRSETGRIDSAGGIVERESIDAATETQLSEGASDSISSWLDRKPRSTPGPARVSKIDIRHVDSRFRELDKAVALLELRVFNDSLGNQFGEAMGRLYDLRNEVALSLAQAETAHQTKLDTMSDDLILAIEELDRQIQKATEAIDSAGANSDHDDDQAVRLWM